jgi:hypothetical protein
MFEGLRFRPAGWLAAIGTLTAMAATMVIAAPGGAAAPEKEFKASFKTECIIGPGSLNQKGTLEVQTRATGPESVTEGESGVEFHNVSSTITSPAELGNTLFALGVRKVRGKVTNLTVVARNLEPREKNIVKPLEFPEGLPYEAPVEQNKPTSFTIPHEGSLSFGPYTVTGKAGERAELEVSSEPGFKEVGSGEFEATGKGIVSTLEGVNAEGGHVIGPLTVACTASTGLVLISIPIEPTSTTIGPCENKSCTTSNTIQSSTTHGACGFDTCTTNSESSSTTHPLPTTSTTTSSGPPEVTFSNWKLTGSLTIKKLGQTINLPAGCTFNGKAVVPGPVEGNTHCPPFTASVKILGILPTTLGLELVQVQPVKGTITPAGGGNLLFKATTSDNINITSVAILGLTIPTSCMTAEPILFPLETTAPSSALATGATFNGEVTLPNVKCGGGFLGVVFGGVLTKLMSGPNNPFTFTIAP